MDNPLQKIGRAAFGAWLLTAIASAPSQALEICDDFTDSSDPFDCDPICWNQVANLPVTFTPTPMGLDAFPSIPNLLGLLHSSEAFAGDVSVSLKAKITGEGVPRSLVAMLHFDPFAFSGYFGGVRRDTAGVWSAAISKYDFGKFLWRQEAFLGFDPRLVEFELEFASVDNLLELRVWPSTQSRPEQAQNTRHDNQFRAGNVGLGYNRRTTAVSRGVFSSICITEDGPVVTFRRGDCNGDGKINLADVPL